MLWQSHKIPEPKGPVALVHRYGPRRGACEPAGRGPTSPPWSPRRSLLPLGIPNVRGSDQMTRHGDGRSSLSHVQLSLSARPQPAAGAASAGSPGRVIHGTYRSAWRIKDSQEATTARAGMNTVTSRRTIGKTSAEFEYSRTAGTGRPGYCRDRGRCSQSAAARLCPCTALIGDGDDKPVPPSFHADSAVAGQRQTFLQPGCIQHPCDALNLHIRSERLFLTKAVTYNALRALGGGMDVDLLAEHQVTDRWWSKPRIGRGDGRQTNPAVPSRTSRLRRPRALTYIRPVWRQKGSAARPPATSLDHLSPKAGAVA